MFTDLVTRFAASCSSPSFFGLKPWYAFLQTSSTCEPIISFFTTDPSSSSAKLDFGDFLLIGLAIVDDLLRVAGLVAVFFVIYGGFLYITSQGSPDQTQKAQNTIQNGLIGLVVAIIAVALVSYIGSTVG